MTDGKEDIRTRLFCRYGKRETETDRKRSNNQTNTDRHPRQQLATRKTTLTSNVTNCGQK